VCVAQERGVGLVPEWIFLTGEAPLTKSSKPADICSGVSTYVVRVIAVEEILEVTDGSHHDVVRFVQLTACGTEAPGFSASGSWAWSMRD
jgi:hypothetical protein